MTITKDAFVASFKGSGATAQNIERRWRAYQATLPNDMSHEERLIAAEAVDLRNGNGQWVDLGGGYSSLEAIDPAKRWVELGDRKFVDRKPPPETITLQLPEPPTINTMLELKARKTRLGPSGWMKRPQSRYWVAQQMYQTAVFLEVQEMRRTLTKDDDGAPAWDRWRIRAAAFRLHQLRDLLELQAGLKWAVDALVTAGVVVDDGPSHLLDVAKPSQLVDRANRGVTLTIERLP